MSLRKLEIVPVVPPDADPYMDYLYARSDLTLGSSADDVLAVAHLKWAYALDVADRVEAAELLLGRRIYDQEFSVLPAEFEEHVFEAGNFDGLVAITSQIAEVKRR